MPMKKTLLTLLALFLSFLSACSSKPSRIISNELSMAYNQYWNALTLDILKGQKDILTSIPHIENDLADKSLLGLWGQSLNFDSNAKKTIVDHQIMTKLQEAFGIRNDNLHVHAGIIHTYGYLFSIIETPYGYKRERWIAPTLNIGFNLQNESLVPWTSDGSLFSNVTFFAGKIAFKNTSVEELKNVSKEIRHFNFNELKVSRLEETIPGYKLVTSFVKLLAKAPQEKNDYLLIYSTINLKSKKEELITAFPVNEETFRKTTDPKDLGENKPITLRYNAFLPDSGTSFKGQRSLL